VDLAIQTEPVLAAGATIGVTVAPILRLITSAPPFAVNAHMIGLGARNLEDHRIPRQSRRPQGHSVWMNVTQLDEQWVSEGGSGPRQGQLSRRDVLIFARRPTLSFHQRR
jgi:hypothetical protein